MDFSKVSTSYRLVAPGGQDITLEQLSRDSETVAMLTMAFGEIMQQHGVYSNGFTLEVDTSEGIRFTITDGNSNLYRTSYSVESEILESLSEMKQYESKFPPIIIEPDKHTVFASPEGMLKLLQDIVTDNQLIFSPSDARAFIEERYFPPPDIVTLLENAIEDALANDRAVINALNPERPLNVTISAAEEDTREPPDLSSLEDRYNFEWRLNFPGEPAPADWEVLKDRVHRAMAMCSFDLSEIPIDRARAPEMPNLGALGVRDTTTELGNDSNASGLVERFQRQATKHQQQKGKPDKPHNI